MSLGSRPTFLQSGVFIHRAIWPQQTWAENWGLCPFRGGEPGYPSNTMWPGPRSTSTPSFVLIRPTVWPQYANVTDRTGQTDRQRSYSMMRTVLQSVAQNSSAAVAPPRTPLAELTTLPQTPNHLGREIITPLPRRLSLRVRPGTQQQKSSLMATIDTG